MAVVIFKAIEKCNSNCVYCDVVKKHQDEIMSADILRLVFERIDEFLKMRPDESVTFTWHGGEVCLLGAEYLRTALHFQNTICRETKGRIEHLVQSNLTCITQDIVDVFKQLGVTQIGSSFEPLPRIRGFGKERDSESYNRKFIEGTGLLDKNGITWGVIYVVHRLSLEKPLEIFHYLCNLNLRTAPAFNQVYIFREENKELAISPEEFAHFLGAIFPEWWAHRDRYTSVRPFSTYVDNIINGAMSHVCEFSGDCAYNWVYIGPKGNTSHCGRAGDFNLLDYGNIRNSPLVDILKNTKRDQLSKRKELLAKTECGECRFWGLCHGGCPLDSLQIYGTATHRSPDCGAIRTFVEHYFEPVTGVRANFPPPSKDMHENP
jgi:uncharacterized protein